MQPLTITIKRGMPGMLQYFGVLTPQPGSDPNPRTPVIGGAPGDYMVVLTLARPGYTPHPEGQYASFAGLEGDSHLAIAKPAYVIAENDDVKAVTIKASTEDGDLILVGTPNKRGFLAQVTAERVWGKDAQDARTKVARAFASSMSSLSAQLDIPLMVYQTDVIELATNNFFMSIISPFPARPMAVTPVAVLSDEFRATTSFYREALNSNTPAFQFLCYFKIIESSLERRKALALEAKTRGESPSRPTHTIPAEEKDFIPWLSAIFHVGRDEWDFITMESFFVHEARGKKFNHVVDAYLRPLRTRIAHAVLTSGELALSADEEMDIREVYKWLALTKCMARHLMKSDFPNEFLQYIGPDGSPIP
jgi:hypothetical protein